MEDVFSVHLVAVVVVAGHCMMVPRIMERVGHVVRRTSHVPQIFVGNSSLVVPEMVDIELLTISFQFLESEICVAASAWFGRWHMA